MQHCASVNIKISKTINGCSDDVLGSKLHVSGYDYANNLPDPDESTFWNPVFARHCSGSYLIIGSAAVGCQPSSERHMGRNAG